MFISILFGCTPMEKNWQIYPDPGSTSINSPSMLSVLSSARHGSTGLLVKITRGKGNGAPADELGPDRCQPAISRINIFVTVVLNVLTDLYLLSVPVPMLWSAKLPTFKKLGLIVLFSGGIFVTMAGILRCVLILTVSVLHQARDVWISSHSAREWDAERRAPEEKLTQPLRTPSTARSKPARGLCVRPSWP